MSAVESPPAFPEVPGDNNAYEGRSGMSLRDWFAGQVLGSGKAAENFQCKSGETRARAEARYCYERSDAMLAERRKGAAGPVSTELADAAHALLAKYGGDVPDWLAEEAAALSMAIGNARGDQ